MKYAEPIVALTPDDAAKVRALIEERDRFEFLWNLEAERAKKAESEGFFDKMKMVRYCMALRDIADSNIDDNADACDFMRSRAIAALGDDSSSNHTEKK